MKRSIVIEKDKFKELDNLNKKDLKIALEKLSSKERKVYEEGYKKTSQSLHIYREVPLETLVPKIISDQKLVPVEGIPWNLISGQLKVRSYDDCRNIWYQNLLLTLTDTSRFHTKESDIHFLRGIISQDPEQESDIKFDNEVQH